MTTTLPVVRVLELSSPTALECAVAAGRQLDDARALLRALAELDDSRFQFRLNSLARTGVSFF